MTNQQRLVALRANQQAANQAVAQVNANKRFTQEEKNVKLASIEKLKNEADAEVEAEYNSQ